MLFSSVLPMAEPVAAFTGIFSGVVIIHEAGHYLAARCFGVPVAEFCIGFPGTPIIMTLFRHRETSFTMRLLLFGGFVRFDDADEAEDTGENSDPAATAWETSEEGTAAFKYLPSGKKAVILVAGSLVNLVAGACLMVPAVMMVKGLGILDGAAAVMGLMGIVVYETFSALLHCDLSGFSGPVGAAGLTRDVMVKGLWPMVGFAGLLSSSMGIMNLLPVPGFDGWHICLAGIEAVRGRPLSDKWHAMAGAAGFAVVVVLMVAITYHDIIRAIE